MASDGDVIFDPLPGRASARYDTLMRDDGLNHYEALIQVVREEVDRALAEERKNG